MSALGHKQTISPDITLTSGIGGNAAVEVIYGETSACDPKQT